MNHRVCILIPTFNNQDTLSKVLDGVLSQSLEVIVVNDGSTDNTSEILSTYSEIRIVEYPQNKGKGFALRQGFQKASEQGFDYAITIDSDGQHDPGDIEKLILEIQKCKEPTVLMGSRNMGQDGVPKKSSFGNNFSNFWFRLYTGIKLSDTQTGFRAYPLDPISKKTWYSPKFEFEIEVLVRLAWAGVEFKEVPIQVYYPEDRVSHFRPFQDFSRISILNTIFFILAFGYFIPRRLLFSKGKGNIFFQIKSEFLKHRDEPLRLAGSVGLGLFFGVFPIWGFQMIVAFAVASWLKLNRILVLAFSNISIPPLVPLIIFGSYWLGSFFVKDGITLIDFSEITIDTIYLQLHQYLIGAVVLSFLLGITGFILTLGISMVRRLLRGEK